MIFCAIKSSYKIFCSTNFATLKKVCTFAVELVMANKTTIYKPHEGCQRAMVRANADVVFAGGNLGAGKMNPLYTMVLTPNGWVRMGDLNVGDYVNTPFGQPARIEQIFEHKQKDIYRLTTNDGRSADCGLEHLWGIRTKKQLFKYHGHHDQSKNISIYNTLDIINALNKGSKVYIPIPYAQEQQEKDYLIPPYALGVMIGDGCLTDKTWVRDRTAIPISSNEEDVLKKFYDTVGGTKIYRQPGCFTKMVYTPNAISYHNYIRETGLNTYSYNKYIPKEYLNGSIRQRRELLCGLLDTDGHTTEQHSVSFSTTSERLKDDVVYLCRSLGYQARVGVDRRPEKYTTGVCYDINILTTDAPFGSKKHMAKYNRWLASEKKFRKSFDHVYVTSIEKIGVYDARCILIDDPLHLYIIDDFLTTHNTFGAALSIAEPSLDPKWRGLVVKNNIDDLKRGGGVIDTFSQELYGGYGQIRMSEMPRLTFPQGSWIDFCHLADQSYKAIMRRFKSSQYDWIYLDELTEFEWDAFRALLTRNRGKSAYAGKCLATTNPERESWIRDFIDWYVDEDGYIIPERDGVIRYFFIRGKTIKEIAWGSTKEEVYRQCRFEIDELVESQKMSDWRPFVKSFTFYEGRMSDNKEMLENNPGYVGTIAMMGESERKKLLGGNWNVSSKDDENSVLTYDEANSVFTNDPQKNGDKWITVDLADSGTNNFLQIAWDGLDIIDIDIAPFTTPVENANRAKIFANKHNIGYSHIIFDAIRGMYFRDYLPEAIPYESYRAPLGLNALQYVKLKDCCYGKLIWLIKNNGISCSDSVANRHYINAASKTTSDITVQNEFTEEARVIRWVDAPNGKKRLMTKKEMNRELGRGRSMDLMDGCSMRMFPLLNYQDGMELESSRNEYMQYDEDRDRGNRVNIYDDASFGISYGEI